MMNLHMLCLDSQIARRIQKRLCFGLMREAGSNPDETSEGQARPDPGDAGAEAQSIPSHVVHAGSDHEHMDLDVADVTPQPSTEQLNEGDKPSDADKNAETEVESMVNVTIQQALSSISLMTSSIIDLTSRPESPKNIDELEYIMANLIQVNKDMEERLDKHGARLHTLEQLDIPHQVSKSISEVVTDVVDWVMQAPLRNRFRDLPEADMKEILHQRMWETESYKTHQDHMQLFEALEKSMNHDHSEELALRPSILLTPADLEMDADMAPDEQAQSSKYEDIGSAHIPTVNLRKDWWKPFGEERPATPEPAWSIWSSDVPVLMNNWASALASNYLPPPEYSLLAQTGDIATFMDWFCKRRGITKLKPQNLEGPAYEIVKVFHPDVIHL
nr:hypothetical protein [Tanacetum cinerariifolium]